MAKYSIPADQQIAEKARNVITSDLSKSWALPVLAAECGVSAYALKRIFRKVWHQEIGEFTLQARIAKAKELLVTTNNTLQMIAEAVGYTEGNNFQSIFKRAVGTTPGGVEEEKLSLIIKSL